MKKLIKIIKVKNNYMKIITKKYTIRERKSFYRWAISRA